MSGRGRHVIEGIWSGYTSSQQRVAHRVVTTSPARYEQLRTIIYADGTALWITVRPCTHREKVTEIHGYTELIEKAVRLKKATVTVAELISA